MRFSRLCATSALMTAWFLSPHPACSAYAQRMTSDVSEDSGTLVAVYRGLNYVAVIADSKVSYTGGLNQAAGRIDGNSKIVTVGRLSACTISGYTGYHVIHSDIARSVRDWVKNNPHVEAKEALPSLLNIAGIEWNRRKFSALERPAENRQFGSKITKVYCGTFVNGLPAILGGFTRVKMDFQAATVIDSQVANVPLYLDGVIETASFENYFNGHPGSYPDAKSQQQYISAMTRLVSDPKAKRFLDAFQMGLIAEDAMKIENLQSDDVRNFFVSLFSIVERTYPSNVSPPNNLILISRGKAVRATLEGSSEHAWSLPPK